MALKLNSSVPAAQGYDKGGKWCRYFIWINTMELPKRGRKNAINYVVGVKSVINNILIKTEKPGAIEKKDVKNAVSKNW
jgi:hypothetical protein